MSTDIDEMELPRTALTVARPRVESLAETTLDMLAVAIVLVDAGARIVHRNAAAAAMLNAGEPIVSHHGRLGPGRMAAAAALLSAVQQAAMGAGKPAVASSSVALPYRDGRAAVAHIRPLSLPRSGPHGEAGAAVFITETTEHAPPPLGALMSLFDLTRSETRVLEQIVSGKNRRETAAALGVAPSTVKTHLDRIYSKTETPDQLALCRLVATLSWPSLSCGGGKG